MKKTQIPCPYCNATINSDAEQCPNCGEYFKEISIPLNISSLGKFIVLNCITLGLYQYMWLIYNLKNINEMIIKEKDIFKLNIPVGLLAIVGFISCINIMSYKLYMTTSMKNLLIAANIMSPLWVLSIILTYIISYRIIRIIERYTKSQYNKEISHSDTWLFFSTLLFMPLLSPMFYLIYFIYTFKERVYNPKPITM